MFPNMDKFRPAALPVMLGCLLAALWGWTGFAVADEYEDRGCARMVRAKPWEPGREVAMPCEEVLKYTAWPLRQPPDVTRLAQSSPAEAAEILGEPFHSYVYERDFIAFYQRGSLLAITYHQNTGKPKSILMSLVGPKNADEIPAWLGLETDSAPLVGVAGPFWNEVGVFKQIETHYPDYKLWGEWVYTVILHIDEAPLVELRELLERKNRQRAYDRQKSWSPQ